MVCFDMVSDVYGYQVSFVAMSLIVFLGPVITLFGVQLISCLLVRDTTLRPAKSVLTQTLVTNEFGQNEFKSLSGHKVSEIPL